MNAPRLKLVVDNGPPPTTTEKLVKKASTVVLTGIAGVMLLTVAAAFYEMCKGASPKSATTPTPSDNDNLDARLSQLAAHATQQDIGHAQILPHQEGEDNQTPDNVAWITARDRVTGCADIEVHRPGQVTRTVRICPQIQPPTP